jgi:hypothetical protein
MLPVGGTVSRQLGVNFMNFLKKYHKNRFLKPSYGVLSLLIKKVKLSPYQAVEAYRVVRY